MCFQMRIKMGERAKSEARNEVNAVIKVTYITCRLISLNCGAKS